MTRSSSRMTSSRHIPSLGRELKAGEQMDARPSGRAALQIMTHWIAGAALTHTLCSSLRIRQAFATPAREMR
eukprot:3850537-Prymnesium_polylepis.1